MADIVSCDYLIIGGGIIGLAIARELRSRFPMTDIVLIEKETAIARHGSGRNSGVLHAGFYYTADSLKAKFCRDGSAEMKRFVQEHGLALNPCRKVVVARNEEERLTLHELKRRGDANGVNTRIVDMKELTVIEPNAVSYGEALFSPDTATVDPVEICQRMARELQQTGVQILTSHPYRKRLDTQTIQAGEQRIRAKKIINAAGLYADRIAHEFGFGHAYTIIPFKGVYLKYTKPNPPLRTNIYPVPNLNNPFLGVHFTITVRGEVKIGPTAIPAFWRENYQGMASFNLQEMAQILGWESVLFATNAFNFRALAWEEIRKYQRSHLINLALPMVKQLDADGFSTWSTPGIRAQLLHKASRKLVQDFTVEGDADSVHILNAISPAFTSSLPFARWVVEHYVI